MKPKVIFVSTVFDDVNTGPGIYAEYLWKAFRDDEDFEFHVVAPSIEERHPRLHGSGVGRNSLNTYDRVQRLARRIAQETAGEVIVHGNAAHSMSEFLGYSGPWIIQINDYEAAEVWKRPTKIISTGGLRRFASLVWRHKQEKQAINKATRVVCNSEYTRKTITESYGREGSSNISVIHKAVDVSQFSEESTIPDPYPERPKDRRLLFVGSDWKRKGLLDLLSALGQLYRRTNSSIHLTVTGPSALGEVEFLKGRADREGIGRHVLFAGRADRDTMLFLYKTSDVFVLPSYFEAFGVVLLEAMAAGLPVVCTRTGGMEEIVRDGRCAATFEAGNVDQLARSIEVVLSDADLRNSMIISGHERAEEFDVKKMVGQVLDLYASVLAEQ